MFWMIAAFVTAYALGIATALGGVWAFLLYGERLETNIEDLPETMRKSSLS